MEQSVWKDRRLDLDPSGRTTLDLVTVPPSCDGATDGSRAGRNAPQLVIDCEALPATP